MSLPTNLAGPRLLVLAAHPDDEMFGAAGLIRGVVGEGWDVTVAFVTPGVAESQGRVREARRFQQAQSAVERLVGPDRASAVSVVTLPGPHGITAWTDQSLHPGDVPELATIISRVLPAPDVLVTHGRADLNADHVVTSWAADVAGRPHTPWGSRLSTVYRMWGPSVTDWRPNAFVRLSPGDLAAMEAALALYDEGPAHTPPHPRSWHAVRARLQADGAVVGELEAEGFEIERAKI